MKKIRLVALLVLPLLLASFSGPSAQAADLRVALFVHPEEPLSLDSPVVQAMAGLTAAALERAPRIDLIPADRAIAVEKDLKVRVKPGSTPHEIRTVAEALKADAIVLLQISVRSDHLLVVNVILFGNDGNRILAINSVAFRGDRREEVQQAMADVLDQLIAALLRL